MVLQGTPGPRFIEFACLLPQAQGLSDFNKALARVLLGSHAGKLLPDITGAP